MKQAIVNFGNIVNFRTTYCKLGLIVIVIVYVDDMILTGNYPQKIEKVKIKLSSVFRTKILEEPKVFLSMKIVRDRKNQTITLHNQNKFKIA